MAGSVAGVQLAPVEADARPVASLATRDGHLDCRVARWPQAPENGGWVMAEQRVLPGSEHRRHRVAVRGQEWPDQVDAAVHPL
jgi:hypothetical protein